jgi:type I site-specific restriction endonuclease
MGSIRNASPARAFSFQAEDREMDARHKAFAVSSNEARHMALRPHLDALSRAAQGLASKAKPHVDSLAQTAQELTMKAKPHVDAFTEAARGLTVQVQPHVEALSSRATEAVASSVQDLTDRAKPKLEALATSTTEATAHVESLRQWCLQQVGCDLERMHTNSVEELAEGVMSPTTEAPVSRGLELDDQPCSQSVSQASEHDRAPCLAPPLGLHLETARLLEGRRVFFAHRNPTLLTQPALVRKPLY